MNRKLVVLLTGILFLISLYVMGCNIKKDVNKQDKIITANKDTGSNLDGTQNIAHNNDPKIIDNSSNTKEEKKIEIYKKGDSGDSIKEIQEKLNKFGYALYCDGEFGEKTFYAIVDFQHRNEIMADGKVGEETLKKLDLEPTSKTMYVKPKIDENAIPASNMKSSRENFFNSKSFNSNTDYYIWVDINNQRVNIFTGYNKNWKLIKSVQCASGKESTPTVKGYFVVQGKGSMFRVNKNTICKYYTQFYGNYLFHSVLLDNNGNIKVGMLGTRLSHGCVRLSIEDAKYIYDYIPIGTAVWIN
ncbi:MAG: ErfK/YbiS/YcfS/YnhG family [Clostridiaceae bacterium]|jgi:lipoprotein-anchoring transpeptidase ErfK/SrfK|nr:ErfK/YbiS/YcfS/YnhG family [Clostridiaceae bacterium]